MSDEKNFSELERSEVKYIIDLKDLADIQTEIIKHLPPAYPDSSTKFVMISSVYLDSPDREFFKYHMYDKEDRIKIRIRKYGPNGKWDEKNVFLEIKEKMDSEVRKTRIQLDKENMELARNAKKVVMNDDLQKLNSPLYSYGELSRFVNKYNRIVESKRLEPVLVITYKRLAYGKSNLRMTLDTNLRFDVVKMTALSDATKIKKSVDWKDVKDYGKRYDPDENAILEIKQETNKDSPWIKQLLDKYDLEPVRMSKYIWSTHGSLDYTLNN